MRYTLDKVQALKNELQAWLERKELTHDTHWKTGDEYYGEEYIKRPYSYYLVLCCGSELTHALWPLCAGTKPLWDEFEQILTRHDF